MIFDEALRHIRTHAVLLAGLLALSGCRFPGSASSDNPRQWLFVGVDESASFVNGPDFGDSLDFLAYYIYGHTNGVGGMDRPDALFVTAIGGAHEGVFYPTRAFENEDVHEIRAALATMFPRRSARPRSDYNAFFQAVASTVRREDVAATAVTVVMVSDGVPDLPRGDGNAYDSIALAPFEGLARGVTVRLLYTGADAGRAWQTQVRRHGVRVWTRDAAVMRSWNAPGVLLAGAPFDRQPRFYDWVEDNVDVDVPARRVD